MKTINFKFDLENTVVTLQNRKGIVKKLIYESGRIKYEVSFRDRTGKNLISITSGIYLENELAG